MLFQQFFYCLISSTQDGYTHKKDFLKICTLQIIVKVNLGREKIHFSLAVLRISLKNRIQGPVEVKNDGEYPSNLYVMLNGHLKIYIDYRIIPLTILSDSATDAIKFWFEYFSESIPYVWAHRKSYVTINRQTETTGRAARKFLTNVVGEISNRR